MWGDAGVMGLAPSAPQSRHTVQIRLGIDGYLMRPLSSSMLATGQATDSNSGPLLILLAACSWPRLAAGRPILLPRGIASGVGVMSG